jgi:hypothetical protein
MRRELGLVLLLALVMSVTVAAQTTARQTSSTTTTTTTQTTVTGPEHNIEGCVVKEGSDYFLIPQRGEPFKLQATANQDFSAQEGHRVMVSGKELSPATRDAQSSEGNASASDTGTGSDLHRLANRELVIDQVRSIAQTCPMNWNPR